MYISMREYVYIGSRDVCTLYNAHCIQTRREPITGALFLESIIDYPLYNISHTLYNLRYIYNI